MLCEEDVPQVNEFFGATEEVESKQMDEFDLINDGFFDKLVLAQEPEPVHIESFSSNAQSHFAKRFDYDPSQTITNQTYNAMIEREKKMVEKRHKWLDGKSFRQRIFTEKHP